MLKTGWKIMLREISYMWSDRGMRFLLLLVPLLGIVVFSAIYHQGVLKDIPAAIVDLDRSSGSRELTDYIRQTENLRVISYPQDYEQLKNMIHKGEVVAGIVIPENYGKNINLRRPVRVYMVIDGSNMVYATNASSAMLEVTGTVSIKTGIKTVLAARMAESSADELTFTDSVEISDGSETEEESGSQNEETDFSPDPDLADPGLTLAQAQNVFQPIDFKEEGWFNPTLNYDYFLLLGLFLNMWQQCCMLLSCMNIIGETGMNSWLQFKSSGCSKGWLFVCKSLTQIIVLTLLSVPIYLIAFHFLKLPLNASFSMLMLFTLCFVVALHSIGTLMSGLAFNSVDSTRLGMLVALPAFVLSGFTWPLEAMPEFLHTLVKILPQTWFLQGINYLSFKRPGGEFWMHYFLMFLLIAGICYGLTVLIVSWKERAHI